MSGLGRRGSSSNLGAEEIVVASFEEPEGAGVAERVGNQGDTARQRAGADSGDSGSTNSDEDSGSGLSDSSSTGSSSSSSGESGSGNGDGRGSQGGDEGSSSSGDAGEGGGAAVHQAGQQAQQQQDEQQQQQQDEQQQQLKPVKQDTDTAELSELAKQHQLTKELVSEVSEDNTVLVTWANFHYKDFVMNWVEHVQATGCKSFLVGAMDDDLLQALLDANVPAFAMSSGLTTKDFGWGSTSFHKMGREKINLIYTFTQMGYTILVSDVDTVWVRNPIPYMAQYPEADLLTSSDHLSNTHSDEGLELWPEAGSAANIGIMLFRPSGHDFAKEWLRLLESDDKIWDQNAFNDIFRKGAFGKQERREDRLFLGWDGRVRMGILPIALFCSGHTFYVQDMPGRLGLKPYVVHGTFQFSGTPGKRNRMRERLLWNDPPEYFDHPKGFIAYEPSVPQQLLDDCANQKLNFTLGATYPHFALVNHQILQMRAQFALAEVFGRAAILARLWCGMDRWWSPHAGVIPGSKLDLPFQCPSDHVLSLEDMSKEGHLAYREYSFLENPRAAKLLSQVATIRVCETAQQAGCGDDKEPPRMRAGIFKLKPGLGAGQLLTALEGVAAKYKVLKFEGGIERAFGGFDDPGQADKFEERLKRYLSLWCCVRAHPGHVWYDFFWDKDPHTDRHNRLLSGPWKPITGP
ncbi:hypothetical protein N2152v2_000856 [Parachlorella kessleri]